MKCVGFGPGDRCDFFLRWEKPNRRSWRERRGRKGSSLYLSVSLVPTPIQLIISRIKGTSGMRNSRFPGRIQAFLIQPFADENDQCREHVSSLRDSCPQNQRGPASLTSSKAVPFIEQYCASVGPRPTVLFKATPQHSTYGLAVRIFPLSSNDLLFNPAPA